jgi:hypothetical protein
MLPHTFAHDGATYVVSFKPSGDQWRAALYKRDDGSITELGPVAAEDLIGLPITPFEPVILGWRNGW